MPVKKCDQFDNKCNFEFIHLLIWFCLQQAVLQLHNYLQSTLDTFSISSGNMVRLKPAILIDLPLPISVSPEKVKASGKVNQRKYCLSKCLGHVQQ